MAITTDEIEPIQATITAEIEVRVPAESDVDLGTEAQQRIASTDGVHTATVEGLDGIQPRLSAIITTVTVTVEATTTAETLRDRLSAAVYVEDIEEFAQSQP